MKIVDINPKDFVLNKEVIYVFDLPANKMIENPLLNAAISQDKYLQTYIDSLNLGKQSLGLCSRTLFHINRHSDIRLAVFQMNAGGDVYPKSLDEVVDHLTSYAAYVNKKPLIFCGNIFNKPEIMARIDRWASGRKVPYLIYQSV